MTQAQPEALSLEEFRVKIDFKQVTELIAYTDYPIPELGDKFYTKAPMRECYVFSYDGENYCEVIVGGMKEVIKSSKIYATPSRSDPLTADQLDLLVK